MYIDKKFVKTIYFLSGLFAVVFPCLILIATGVAEINVRGFSVDSAGRLYIGKYEKIEVYEDKILVNQLSSKTSKEYAFAVQPDNTILLSTSTVVYHMDLNGNILDSYPDHGTNIINALKKGFRETTLQNGDTYALKGSLTWPRIVKNGKEVVYRISTISFVVKTVLSLAIIAFTLFLIKNVAIPVFAEPRDR